MKNLYSLPVTLIALFLFTHPALSQKPDIIKPTDNLIVKNIPEIPTAIASEVKQYTESRSAYPTDWHPLKREMMIATRFGNTTQLHYLKMPSGARKQITFFDEQVGNADFEPLNGDYFIFSRDVGGNEFGQLYRYTMSDGKIDLLTDGGRSQNGNVVWNNAKKTISFTSTKRNGTDRDIYTMNPRDSGSVKLVHEVSGGGWSVSDWSPDDKQMLIQQGLSVNESNIYVLNLETKEKKLVSPSSKKETVASGAARFSKDGKQIFFITDHENEFRRLAIMNTDGSAMKFITSGLDWDVSSLTMEEGRKRALFTTNENGLTNVYLLNMETLEWKPVTGLPVGLLSSFSWRKNSDEFFFSYSSAKNNSDVYTHDLKTGKTERWTESELGGIVESNLTEPRLIKWKSFDGLEISGFLYSPSKKFTGKRPVMINIHGGPEGQSRPGFQGRNNYFLEEIGVAIIYPNVRGSSGFGKTFVKLDNGMLRENSVKDIGALLDWIATQPDLDASRIMVTGGSYGGYMALAVSVMYADKIRCAVDVVGISNFNTFLKNTESYRRDLRRVEYGDEQDPEMFAFLEKISPNNNAAKIQKPLFIVQGGNDPRVPRTEAEQMFNTLNEAGKTVWYLEAKDEGHGFRKKNNIDYQFYATVEFMRKYLLN